MTGKTTTMMMMMMRYVFSMSSVVVLIVSISRSQSTAGDTPQLFTFFKFIFNKSNLVIDENVFKIQTNKISRMEYQLVKKAIVLKSSVVTFQ